MKKTTPIRVKTDTYILLEELRLKIMKSCQEFKNISKQDLIHILVKNAYQTSEKTNNDTGTNTK